MAGAGLRGGVAVGAARRRSWDTCRSTRLARMQCRTCIRMSRCAPQWNPAADPYCSIRNADEVRACVTPELRWPAAAIFSLVGPGELDLGPVARTSPLKTPME